VVRKSGVGSSEKELDELVSRAEDEQGFRLQEFEKIARGRNGTCNRPARVGDGAEIQV